MEIILFSIDSHDLFFENASSFLSFFSGQVDLPDAHSETYWKKVGSNGTDLPSHIEQIKTNRLVKSILYICSNFFVYQ